MKKTKKYDCNLGEIRQKREGDTITEEVPFSIRILAPPPPGAPRNGEEPHARPSSTVRRQRRFEKLSFPFSHVEKASLLAQFPRKVSR